MVEQSAEVKCPTLDLASGSKIPVVGLGTFLHDECKQNVKDAILKYGYRHIDTAMIYKNEEKVGEAIQECLAAGIKREELFITTKLWHTDKSDVEGAIKTSLAKLKLDYVDLYLIHWMRPEIDWENGAEIKTPPHHVVWSNMEKLVEKGLAKNIGVSNCTIPMLYDLLAGCKIRPAVNQIEVHPYLSQKRVIEFHHKYGIKIEGYAAIGSNHAVTKRAEKIQNLNLLEDPVIKEIATAKGKSPAQVCIAWHVTRGTIPLAKTTKEERLLENIAASYDLTLTPEEMEKIDALD